MTTRFLLCPVALITIIFSSCGSGHENEIDPITRLYDSIAKADSLRVWGPPTVLTFDTEPEYQVVDMHRVSIEGYIGIPESITQTETTTIIQLWERKGQRAGECYSIGVNMGTGINTMDSLPENYVRSDLKVRDKLANVVEPGQRVRITGIYHRPVKNAQYGMIDVQMIEVVGDKQFDYAHSDAPLISPDIIRVDTVAGLVCADGYIIVPSSLKVAEFVPLKLIEERSSSDSLSIHIPIGPGANQIRELPDNYSDEDVYISDHDNKRVEYNRVRVYGVWHEGAIAVEYILMK